MPGKRPRRTQGWATSVPCVSWFTESPTTIASVIMLLTKPTPKLLVGSVRLVDMHRLLVHGERTEEGVVGLADGASGCVNVARTDGQARTRDRAAAQPAPTGLPCQPPLLARLALRS